MAVSGSGLFCQTFIEALTNAIALDLSAEDMKVAMFTNTITPDFTNDTAYAAAPYDANEVSGTGYTAGGELLATTTLTAASGTLTFDAADASWTSSTISSARCALVYADALATNDVVCLIDFGQDYSTSNGTFAIQWNASGIFTLDLVP